MNKFEAFENALKDLWKEEDIMSSAAVILFIFIPSTILMHSGANTPEIMMLYINLFTVFVAFPIVIFFVGRPIFFFLKYLSSYRQMEENNVCKS